MDISDIVAAIAVAVSAVSIGVSILNARKVSKANRDMFQRQGIIDLHKVWQDLREINPQKPITPPVVRAVNTLSLTASLWLHNVVSQKILYQSYWFAYKSLYESLEKCDQEVPGTNKKGYEFISPMIRKVYGEMARMELDKVDVSRI